MIVAFAVAVLPAVGGAVRVAKAMEAASMASAEQCCEHGAQPCEQDRHATDDCASIAVCAVKCFNFAGLAACDVSYVPAGAVAVTIPAAPIFVSHTDPPPFPPPRI